MTKENHCTDCCCAQSWAALGITEYTGKSIPEHIAAMREALEEFIADSYVQSHGMSDFVATTCESREKALAALGKDKGDTP